MQVFQFWLKQNQADEQYRFRQIEIVLFIKQFAFAIYQFDQYIFIKDLQVEVKQQMSLFVGNVSKNVSHKELENLFKKYGKSKVDLRDRYAFVQFEVDSHAEAAKKQLQHQTFYGLELNIEWSKNSGRFGENNKRKEPGLLRKRSRSRQNRWRRQERWVRRSPSYERSSPSYSGNKQFEAFVCVCPRDEIIQKNLIASKTKQQEKHKELHKKIIQSKDHQPPGNGVTQSEHKNHNNSKIKQQLENRKIDSIHQNIEESDAHEDGQIPNAQ